MPRKDSTDGGRTGDKVPVADAGMAPLGTDEEAPALYRTKKRSRSRINLRLLALTKMGLNPRSGTHEF
jgi:hypothetical protein